MKFQRLQPFCIAFLTGNFYNIYNLSEIDKSHRHMGNMLTEKIIKEKK